MRANVASSRRRCSWANSRMAIPMKRIDTLIQSAGRRALLRDGDCGRCSLLRSEVTTALRTSLPGWPPPCCTSRSSSRAGSGEKVRRFRPERAFWSRDTSRSAPHVGFQAPGSREGCRRPLLSRPSTAPRCEALCRQWSGPSVSSPPSVHILSGRLRRKRSRSAATGRSGVCSSERAAHMRHFHFGNFTLCFCRFGNRHAWMERMYGTILRQLRETKGRSQAEVARSVGVSAAKLARLEANQRGLSVEDFVRITQTLGERPGNLLPNDLGDIGHLKPLIDRIASVPP